jgi:hypothetical protein
VVGENDEVAAALELEVDQANGSPAIIVPGIGPLRGEVRLYSELLTSGKSAETGRSHGFFVTVLGRLINLDDPLFGLPALSHGPFNRFWMRVEADGLDDLLRSTREAVLVAEPVPFLRKYLTAKFNEARTYYDNWLSEVEQQADLAVRLAGTPTGLSTGPMLRVIERVLAGELEAPLLTMVPVLLDEEARETLISELKTDLLEPTGIVKEVKFADLGVDGHLATYSVEQRSVLVNNQHPST